AGIANRGGDGAATVFVGRHAELRRRLFIQAAAGAVSSVVHGAGHGVSGLQVALEQTQAAGIGVLARRDAQGGLEAALQVKRTLTKFFAEAVEGHWFVEVLLDETANRLHA